MEELIFQYLPLTIEASQPFGVLNRPHGTVVILLRDKNGRWALGRKSNLYPEGISRMLGGGIDLNEHPAIAARRELQEESGVAVDEEKMIPLLHAEVTSSTNPDITGTVFVFYAQTFQDIHPADDIDQITYLSDREFNDLVQRFQQLPDQPLGNARDYPSWSVYGQVWGPIHAAALARVKDLSL